MGGGPCLCGGSSIGPSTDNFALCTFEIDGLTYHSAEHAYQASKMRADRDRRHVAACRPRKGESSWDFGMRVWNQGQRLPAKKDWETTKVQTMYEVNKAKLMQNLPLAAELCSTDGEITHRGSGKFWDKWNPVILMLLREELKDEDGNLLKISELQALVASASI